MNKYIILVIGIVLLNILLNILFLRSGKVEKGEIELEEVESINKKCIIQDGYLICENPSAYSYFYYPWWYYRYPYHRGAFMNGRALPFRRRWGRRHGRL